MSTIEWAEPPTARNQAIEDFGATLTVLRQHPKRWAKVTDLPGFNLNVAAREGSGPFSPPKSFQVKRVPAAVAGERADIYIRYVGDAPAEDEADGGDVESESEAEAGVEGVGTLNMDEGEYPDEPPADDDEFR